MSGSAYVSELDGLSAYRVLTLWSDELSVKLILIPAEGGSG